MTTVVCPRCRAENAANAVNCRSCHINLTPALEHAELLVGAEQDASQAEQVPAPRVAAGPAATVLRWIGRVWGLLLIFGLSLVLFFWYVGSASGAGPPGFVYLVGCVIILGLVVAWWREGLGALISLAGLVGFYVALFAYERDQFRYWSGIFLFLLPAILCLLASSWLRRRMSKELS